MPTNTIMHISRLNTDHKPFRLISSATASMFTHIGVFVGV